MAKVILSHRVANYDSWKTKFDADKPRRDAMGITEIAVGKKSDDHGLAYMIWEVADAAELMKMSTDPELQKVMQEAGVISAPEVTILD
jgi:hypothetical protein